MLDFVDVIKCATKNKKGPGWPRS